MVTIDYQSVCHLTFWAVLRVFKNSVVSLSYLECVSPVLAENLTHKLFVMNCIS